MRMTQEEFDRERRYQTAAYFTKKMLLEGLITEEEFYQIDTRNREKYKPFSGSLLSGKFLLCASKRANIGLRKEAESHAECEKTGTGSTGS